ncbi:MAG: DUF971 domain-containing protein [Spirochaetales bacterium]|nr:DUF971 domain-containing protein [Spirochaetales bacterium]
MTDQIPDTIRYDEEKLYIRWRDGRECSYNLLELRRNCPCAMCMGGHGGSIGAATGHIKEIKLNAWKKVGRYALQFTWSDNHDTGIYRLDELRKACE